MEKKTQYITLGFVAAVAGAYFLLKPKTLAAEDAPYGGGESSSGGYNTGTSTQTPPISSSNSGSGSSSVQHSAYLPQIVITKDGTRLRKSASVLSSILKTFKKNVQLEVLSSSYKIDGMWYQVEAPTGEKGWVRWDVVVKMDSSYAPSNDTGSTVNSSLQAFEEMFGFGDY